MHSRKVTSVRLAAFESVLRIFIKISIGMDYHQKSYEVNIVSNSVFWLHVTFRYIWYMVVDTCDGAHW
jgi:hypothetical protein